MEQEQDDLAEFGMPAERVQPSSSKRKRSRSGDLYMTYRDTTPKRNRSTDWSRSEKAASSTGKHSVRRKKAQYNLSSLGWHHSRADGRQKRDGIARASSTSRLREGSGSRFQEGSMNDKPSIVPPSLFMRDNSDHSMAASARSANVDHLMDDYNGGHVRQSIEVQPQHHRPSASVHLDLSAPDTPTKPSGLYRFGRMVASSFNPANVWGSFSRTFRDTKDEMTMRNIEENRKRAQQLADVEAKYAGMKAEAEAKYAEMKAAGLFAATSPFTVVNNRLVTAGMQSPARPSVHVSVAQVAAHPQQHTSPSKQPRHDNDDQPRHTLEQPDSEVANQDASTHGAATPQKPLKSYKSLFGIRRPSFANLKRARSDYNLSSIARTSQDAPSVSPDKGTAREGPEPTNLRKSISRRDLGRQQKLSKRVSDLETKLACARRELNFAIDSASPLPNMPSPHEKYKPNKHMTPTARFRARFMPGGLVTLPSESLLPPPPPPPDDPADQQEEDLVHLFTPPPRSSTQNPSFDLPLHSLNATIDSTLQSSPNKMLTSPSLPQHYSNINEKPLPEPPIAEDDSDNNNNNEDDNTMQNYGDQVDSDTIVVAYTSPSQPVSNHDNLNSRLKALDRAVQTKSRRKSGTRKRKSQDDKEYRPSTATDDEEDDSLSLKKPKKRKSLPRSATRKSSASTKEESAVAGTSTAKRTVSGSSGSSRKSSGQHSVTEHDSVYDEHTIRGTSPFVVIEQEEPAPSSNLESNSQAVLDMIAEEGGAASDSRHDSGVSVTAAQAKSLRNANTRRVSPPTILRCSETTTMQHVEEEMVVTVTPGADGVPEMPRSGLGLKTKTKKNTTTTENTTEKQQQTKTKQQQPVPENFEWPDDVF